MRNLAIIIAAAAMLVAIPAAADAATWQPCKITGNLGFTNGPNAVGVFKHLKARAPMSCSSARYVLNRWVRRQYANVGLFDRKFYDGYVTWRGHLAGARSTGSHAGIVEYRERTTGTAFRFDFYEYSD